VKADLIVKNARQLATPFFSDDGNDPPVGGLLVLEDAAIACAGDKIIWIGHTSDLKDNIDTSGATTIDASGKTVLPGFVDAHTHFVFAATRENEFELRIKGKSYQEIAAAGGGIKSSVKKLRQASEEELITQGMRWLDQFLAYGTTTVEAKSGYGLSLDAELKMLRVFRELNNQHQVEIIPTFLGAHEIPEEYKDRREHYIDLIIQEMLPNVAEEKLAEYCDVFCEEHVFTVSEARRILTAAKELGLKPKIHADQLSSNGGAELAAEVGAISADHLDHISQDGMSALLEAGVVPVLLPGAVYFLGLSHYAPARQMIENGLPVAIATDFNPGSSASLSMPTMMSIACTQMRMTPAEALVATTHHAARAVERDEYLGILDVSKQADMVLWDVSDYKLLPYHFGMNFVDAVIKKGKIVYSR